MLEISRIKTLLHEISRNVYKFLETTRNTEKVGFENMQVSGVQVKGSQKLQNIVEEMFNAEAGKFEEMFYEYVLLAIEDARDAKEFAAALQPLLRKAGVWVDPGKVQAVSVELGKWNEVVVRIHLPTREVKVTKYGAEVLPLEFYVYSN